MNHDNNTNKLNGLMSPPLSPPSFSSTYFPPRSTSLNPNLNSNSPSSSSSSPPSSLSTTKKSSYSSTTSSTPNRLSKVYPDYSTNLPPFSPPISPKAETKNVFQYPIITPIQKVKIYIYICVCFYGYIYKKKKDLVIRYNK